LIKSSSVPSSVKTVITIPGTTIVIVASKSLPKSEPSTSIQTIPHSVISPPVIPSTAVHTISLPPKSSLPSSPVLVHSSSVPSSVKTIVTITGRTTVIVPSRSLPKTFPSTSIQTLPSSVTSPPPSPTAPYTLPLPSPTVIPSSPVLIRSKSVPVSVKTIVTIVSTSIVIVPASSLPSSVPTTSY
jgi:hypothetical protein